MFACNTFSHFRNTVNISFKGTVIGRGILLKEEDGELSLNYFESGKKMTCGRKVRKKMKKFHTSGDLILLKVEGNILEKL